jgi:quinol monooxygenase YgiN
MEAKMERRDVLGMGSAAIVMGTAALTLGLGTRGVSAAGPTIGHGFHATMTANPGMGDALVELLLRAPSLPHDDCLVFLVGRSASNPDLVFVTEGWVSEEAHGAFFASDVAQAYVAEFGPLVKESVNVDEVPVGGKAILS